MLPPILSVSNTPVQHKVPPRQDQDGHSRGRQQGHAQEERNPQGSIAVSNAATGRVNVLNLSGPEMAMDLSKLSEAIARALDLPAGAGEGPTMHALRLANAILALNAGPSMALERQLSHLLQGLSLQLVAMALKNPGGAEAARITAYLELGRQKGDAVAQAVVASYQQNEASDEEGLLALAVRSARPDIELKGVVSPYPYEEHLSEAAFSAAQRAGIALPHVHQAISDDLSEAEEDGHRRHASHDHDEDTAGNPGNDEQTMDQDEEEAQDTTLLSPASDTGDTDDDLAYVYYQRMSGGL